MKKLLFVLCICFAFNCAAQKPSGVYLDEKSNIFFAIKGDSISIGYGERFAPGSQSSFYYGNYKFEDGEMKLCKNLLNSRNSYVDTVYSVYEGVEILPYRMCLNYGLEKPDEDYILYYVVDPHSRICLEADETIPRWTNFDDRSKMKFFANDSIVRIGKEIINEMKDSIVACWIDCYQFSTVQRLKLKPHTRYVVKQKYHSDHRLDIVQVLIVYNSCDDMFYVTPSIYWISEGLPLHHLKRVGKCKSCLGELKKYYPDILNRTGKDVERITKRPDYEHFFNQQK